MNFGEDPDRVPERPALKRRVRPDFGAEDTESAPKPVRHRKPSAIVLAEFLDRWDRLVMKRPEYAMFVAVNKPAFSKYLNETFFSEGKFTVDEVLNSVRLFMDDLEHGNIVLTPKFPVWISFTKNWRRYELQSASNTDKVTSLLERLQADEWKF